MDMVFPDDECRIPTGHAPTHVPAPKHMAHDLIGKAPGTAASSQASSQHGFSTRARQVKTQCHWEKMLALLR
jgi:hypothetical protein